MQGTKAEDIQRERDVNAWRCTAMTQEHAKMNVKAVKQHCNDENYVTQG